MPHARWIQTECLHCGTPFEASQAERFCCRGCEFVYRMIQDEGLGQYYRLREASPPACPAPAQASTATYEFCDDPEFIRKTSPDGLRLRFYVEGLNCSACIWLLEKLPDYCGDAQSARVDMSRSTVEIRRRPGGSFASVARALNRFGYRPHPIRESEESRVLQRRERRRDLIRIGTAAACAGNIMILAVSLYAGATGPLADRFAWLSAALAAPALTFCAWPFYRSAWASLRARRLNIDVPIVAAILSGVGVSAWSLAEGKGDVYFDSLSTLVLLLLSSRFLLKAIQDRNLGAANLEDELLLATVERVRADGTTEKTSSLSLEKGDVIRVERPSVVPADGVVASGWGAIDASVLTGESMPVDVAVGDRVEAGSRAATGRFELRVERPPAETRLAKILRDTEHAARAKSDFTRMADGVAQWFIAIVFAAAALIVLAFAATDPREGVERALALVIVTCPCVFGMAIPLSMTAAIRAAARRGAVVKDANAIERLWGVRTIFFDKTGTLTDGEMAVLAREEVVPGGYSVALGLESGQAHPVARAIARELRAEGVAAAEVADVSRIVQGGVEGRLGDERCSAVPASRGHGQDLADGGFGPGEERDLIRSSYVVRRGQAEVARFQIGDRPRAEAADVVAWARARGFAVRVLSGDRRNVVAACAARLGFWAGEAIAEASPERKVRTVREAGGGVAMIGDGANDAAALAAADVGIAMGGSLDVSLRAADAYLSRSDLRLVPELFWIADRTRAAIRRNLALSVAFNLVSGALAASGRMTPLWAAVLMPLSSFSVLLSAAATGRALIASRSPVARAKRGSAGAAPASSGARSEAVA